MIGVMPRKIAALHRCHCWSRTLNPRQRVEAIEYLLGRIIDIILEGGVILRFLEIRCEDTLKVLSRLKDDGEYFFLFFKLGVTPLYTPSEVYPKHPKNAFLGQKCQFLIFFWSEVHQICGRGHLRSQKYVKVLS